MGRAVLSFTVAEYQGLATALPKYCASTVFTVAGQTYTTPEVVGFINAILSAQSAVASARAAIVAALQAVVAAEEAEGQVVKGVRDIVAVMFNNAPVTLNDFQIAPRKPRTPLTVQAKAAAKAKSAATRLARGTKGKKQAAAIRGNVTGVVITPVSSSREGSAPATAPAAPVTPAAPVIVNGSSTPHT